MADRLPTPPLQAARLQWDAQGQPLSEVYGDVYFSKASGLDETHYVFLNHNGLPERWRHHDKPVFTIAETGFGSGLNFLATWQQWRQHAPPGLQLHFISVEKHPLSAEDLAQAQRLWPDLAPLADALQRQSPPPCAGYHRLRFDDGRVVLTLLYGEAEPMFAELDARVDAWYLDGFAPAKNPEMWSEGLFRQVGRLSAAGATFSTFTAAGLVRKGLQAEGFEVEKVAGFGRKRHMLRGRRPVATPPAAAWHRRPDDAGKPSRALVIGAGIAGCSTARALAERGVAVTLIERGAGPASAASGNPQGILYAKLPAVPTQESRIHLAGYLYSLRRLSHYLGEDANRWQSCGVLQLAQGEAEAHKQHKLIERGHYPAALVQAVDAAQASAHAGRTLFRGGLLFPGGGWVDPAALCRALLDHPLIDCRYQTTVARMAREAGAWVLLDGQQREIDSAGVLVVANAADAQRFEPLRGFPLKRIRGQVSSVPLDDTQPLQCVLCGQGYVSPPRQGRFCFGASFDLKATEAEVLAADHQHNLDRVRELCPELADALEAEPKSRWQGRAAFRCASPDYLPLVGPAPREADFIDCYAALRQDAKATVETAPPLHPGLYVSLAHGSKGLATAPLAGELLAGYICNEPLALESPLLKALHPARFLVKNLIRRAI